MTHDEPSKEWIIISNIIQMIWNLQGYGVKEMPPSVTTFDMVRRDVLIANLEKMREDDSHPQAPLENLPPARLPDGHQPVNTKILVRDAWRK